MATGPSESIPLVRGRDDSGKVLRQMLAHPLTAAGIARFNEDWDSRPELGAWMENLLAGAVNHLG